MRIGGFSFLNRTNSPYTFSIAAWHSRHSLTWRWLIHWCWFRGDERRVTWRLLWWHRSNGYFQAHLLIPFVGLFHVSTQQSMWYRDLHSSARDRAQRLEDERNRMEREVSKTIASAIVMSERGDRPLH